MSFNPVNGHVPVGTGQQLPQNNRPARQTGPKQVVVAKVAVENVVQVRDPDTTVLVINRPARCIPPTAVSIQQGRPIAVRQVPGTHKAVVSNK